MEVSQWGLALFSAALAALGFLCGAAYDLFSFLPMMCGRVYDPVLNKKLSERGAVSSRSAQSKNAESKNAESKNAESKNAESKNAESKNAESKNAESKNAELKDIGDGISGACARAAVFLHDLIFMICSGAAFILAVYRFNDGRFRISSGAFFVVGFCIYRLTLRRFTAVLTELLRYVIIRTVYTLTRPLVAIFRALRSAVLKAAEKHRRRKAESYTEKYIARLKKSALTGCLDVVITEEKDGRKKKKEYASSERHSADSRFLGHHHRRKSDGGKPEEAGGGKISSREARA